MSPMIPAVNTYQCSPPHPTRPAWCVIRAANYISPFTPPAALYCINIRQALICYHHRKDEASQQPSPFLDHQNSSRHSPRKNAPRQHSPPLFPTNATRQNMELLIALRRPVPPSATFGTRNHLFFDWKLRGVRRPRRLFGGRRSTTSQPAEII